MRKDWSPSHAPVTSTPRPRTRRHLALSPDPRGARHRTISGSAGLAAPQQWPAQATAPALGLSQSAPSRIDTPEQTIGPYFVDEDLVRSYIRIDLATGTVNDGVPLRLTL